MLAGVMAVWLVPLSAADDPLAWSMKWIYIGRTSPPQTSEIWIADRKNGVYGFPINRQTLAFSRDGG